MASSRVPTEFYKRSNFVTHLPVEFLYSPSHYWLAPHGEGLWRVGFTKFASRMLGEIVEHEFQLATGAPVAPGDIIGWIEGFKALSDVYCVGHGEFLGGNPALKDDVGVINKDPYGSGWLYDFRGSPDAHCTDCAGYRARLDATIDRMLEKQQASETPEHD